MQVATRTKLPSPVSKPINSWLVCSAAVLFGLFSLYMATIKHNHSSTIDPRDLGGKPVEEQLVAVATPASTPVIPTPIPSPAPIVPRAEPVTGPMTTEGTPMVSGNQYYVTMPDGRHILVNYKGWIDHVCNLPRQPRGGANNAAYTDVATGLTWIWTVPTGTSNIPQWIDP
jgi:hypothetical protein